MGEIKKVFDYSTSGGMYPEASTVLVPTVWFVELRNVEEGFWRRTQTRPYEPKGL